MRPTRITTRIEREQGSGDTVYLAGSCGQSCLQVSPQAEIVHVCPSYRVQTVSGQPQEFCLCQDD